jgi:hypothetical protein
VRWVSVFSFGKHFIHWFLFFSLAGNGLAMLRSALIIHIFCLQKYLINARKLLIYNEMRYAV